MTESTEGKIEHLFEKPVVKGSHALCGAELPEDFSEDRYTDGEPVRYTPCTDCFLMHKDRYPKEHSKDVNLTSIEENYVAIAIEVQPD